MIDRAGAKRDAWKVRRGRRRGAVVRGFDENDVRRWSRGAADRVLPALRAQGFKLPFDASVHWEWGDSVFAIVRNRDDRDLLVLELVR